MDVTNLRTLLSFAELPQNAIAQTQVKPGGYGVEYGRAMGGIINIVTKSGSNDWKSGGSVYSIPAWLMASDKDIYTHFVDDEPEVSIYNRDDSSDVLAYTAYLSGPLIKDSLFFYTNFEGKKVEINDFSRRTSRKVTSSNPSYMAKVDWYINPEHMLRLTHINNRTIWEMQSYNNQLDPVKQSTLEWIPEHGTSVNQYDVKEGGDINVLSYTGYLTDDLTLNIMLGQLTHQYQKTPNLSGDDCPLAYDTTGGVGWSGRKAIGCWNSPDQIYVKDTPDDVDKRRSFKLDGEYVLGDHSLRFGYNREKYDSTSPGVKYSGDAYYRYRTAHNNNGCRINGVDLPCGTDVVRVRKYNTESATFGVINTAWYLEDRWLFNDGWLFYAGIRGETFTNLDGTGEVFLKSDNLVAPRVGFAWDIDGDSSRKLSMTLGRYYLPVASNTNIRSTRVESSSEDHYLLPGGWKQDGSPVQLGKKFGRSIRDVQHPDPATIADHNLNPMFQDEIILSYQQTLGEAWLLSTKVIGRTIGNGMDDFCGHDGFTRWAEDNGYDKFDPHSMAGCIIVNPGKDITLSMDLENNGQLTSVTTPASYHGLPEYKRHYLGLQLLAERSLDDNWEASVSYTLSRTFGNAEGYVNSSLAQEDPGATQDFDHQNFMHGAYGNLPTDRTHQIKAYAYYALSSQWATSVNISLISGIPLSCLGYASTDGMMVGDGTSAYDEGSFSRYSASSFYCIDTEKGRQTLRRRGSEGRSNWLTSMDLGVIYTPDWLEGLSFKALLGNVFNTQRPTVLDQTKDYERDNVKIANPNFLTPSRFQLSRYLRLSAHYKF